jgi:hypothetical protein
VFSLPILGMVFTPTLTLSSTPTLTLPSTPILALSSTPTLTSLSLPEKKRKKKNQWKTSSIHALFDPFSAQEILKICISIDPEPNYIWTHSTFGHFSTSSTYHFITSTFSNFSFPVTPNHFWKSL